MDPTPTNILTVTTRIDFPAAGHQRSQAGLLWRVAELRNAVPLRFFPEPKGSAGQDERRSHLDSIQWAGSAWA